MYLTSYALLRVIFCVIITGFQTKGLTAFFKLELHAGLLIFRAVADPWNSGISAKSREIPKKTRNTAKSARNISKYMSAKNI